MKKLAFGFLLLVGILGAAPGTDPMDAALAKIGLTKQTARIDRDNMNIYGGDRYRLQLFDLFMNDPYKMPDYVPVLCRSALSNCNSIGLSVMFASLRVKAGVRRGLLSNPVTDYEKLIYGDTMKTRVPVADPLAKAIADLYEDAPEGLQNPKSKIQNRGVTALLPDSLNRALALLVKVSDEALEWRDLAFARLSPAQRKKLYRASIDYLVSLDSDTTQEEVSRLVEGAIGRIDYEYLNLGATDLGLVLDSVVPRLSRMKLPDSLHFSCSTPLGRIVVNGRENNTYEYDPHDPPFIILDLGGDDSYTVGASNLSVDNPISILIDLGGNDRYESDAKNRPAFGGALLGYSFLVDLQGNDLYRSKNLTQGSGVYGVGVLWDGAGNDTYDAYTVAQGGGSFGLGVLVDKSDDDVYRGYQQCQGYGYTKGCGVLIDSTGNDRYIANDSNIVFPAAQSKEHNTSLAQGMGFGKRADYSDGHSLAGGVGVLIDGTGDDSYSCGIFGQGCSYWYGVGILGDLAGNDSYNGIWYVQGAGAHFGVAMQWDAAGNDHYKATMNMAQGAGHDFTVGWLMDDAGNDIYDAPNLSLGGGNDNGFGYFWDKGGDDVFNVTAGTTLGRANITAPRGVGLRDYMMCLGVFLHTGSGHCTYPKDKPFAKVGTIWTQAGLNDKEPIPTEKGVGLDW
jgi:hypothetical protein